ncbi:hypothetical protein OA958_03555, partial [Bacteroidota bacterium]|nr:hypothetical protein [Bacteroidota bacterium]
YIICLSSINIIIITIKTQTIVICNWTSITHCYAIRSSSIGINGSNTQWAVGRLSSSPNEFYIALRASDLNYNQISSNGFNFQANEWTHVSVIWDGDNVLFYKNGILISTSFAGQFSLNATTGNLLIGAQENGTGFNWNGSISNYSNWNSALTQSEIQSYMSSPPTGNEAGLVGYWNFNEGSGSTVTDLSGNGNNGTINGATWITDAPAQYANNCTATDDIVVTLNPLPTIDLGADTTLICDGTSQTLDAGTGLSSYSWSDGSTNQTLSATTAGTYTVTGTDVNGCTASDSMVIDVLNVDITQNDTTICEGDSLVLEINGSGGSSQSGTFQLPTNLNSNLVGFWPLNGNTNDISPNVNNGVNNGAVLTTDRNNNLNNAYKFNNSNNEYISISYSSAFDLGTDNITISSWFKYESNNSIYSRGTLLRFDNGLSQTRQVWGLRVSQQELEFLCGITNSFGGVTTIKDNSYSPDNLWHHFAGVREGNELKIYFDGVLTKTLTTSTIENLNSNGTYYPSIGRNGSSSAEYFNGKISEVGLWNKALNSQEIQQLYTTSSNYTYSWSPGGETTSSITVQPSATTTYTVDVTSGTTTCQSDVTISVNQRDFVSIDSTACDSIQWNGNWLASTDTYIGTLQNIAGCDSIVTLNLTINQSTSGTDVLSACDSITWIDGITYSASNDTATYTLTNSVGCDSVVTLNLTIHTSPTVDLGNDTILCSGTTIDLNAGSGFTYSWQDGTNDSTLTASSSGAYSVTITDGNGCSDSDTINVTIATPLLVTLDSTNISCNGLTDGTATATVTGGTPDYSYLWDDANAQTTDTATNLSAGTYSVTITDGNNCTATETISITEPTLLSAITQAPPQFGDFVYLGEYHNNNIYFHNTNLTWTAANQKCLDNGGQLLVINSASEQSYYESILPYPAGWIGLYQDVNDPNYSEPSGGWKWVDGTPLTYDNWATSGSIDANSPFFTGFTLWSNQPQSTSENYAGFGPFYEWHDRSNNQYSTFAMAIAVSQANSLSVGCNGGNDGSTYVTAGGGTAPYSYAWDNGQTTDTAYNLSAGDYIVTVTDASGCTATDTATITEPNLITGLDSITACDTYTWIDGNTYNTSNNTATHTLVAANGCDSVVTLNLTIITSPTVDLGNDVAICDGDSTLLDAGSGHTNYLWNTGETTQTIYADTAGNYNVTVGNGTPIVNSNSLSFDGQDDYSEFSNPSNSTSYTYLCWIKPSSVNGGYIVSRGHNTHWIEFHSSGALISGTSSSSFGTTYYYNTVLSVDNWYHVAISFDGSNFTQYVDGIQTFSIPGNSVAPSNNMLLGKDPNHPQYIFSGLIDEVCLWDIVLSPQEIQQYMSSPPTGNEAGLVGYWNFNEGSGNTVTDLTGNGNNGTINGATWTTDAPAQYANNCTATDDVVVTVNPLPTIDLGADTTLICDGTSETLDAGTGFDSYLWSDGSTNQTLSANLAGTYTVTGTDANGCSASDSMVIDVLTVDITQNDTTICEGDSLVLFANGSQTYPSGSNNSQLSGTLNNGLVGYWPFNGNANDESGNGNNGTVNGATLTNDRFGNLNSAYLFNSSPDRIEISSNLSSTGFGQIGSEYTVSGWSNKNNTSQALIFSDYNSIAGNSNPGENDLNIAVHLSAVSNPSQAAFSIRSNQTNNGSIVDYSVSGGQLTENDWHLITASVSQNGIIKLYLDAILVSSSSFDNSISYFDAPVYRIGASMWNGNYHGGDGIIDDVTVWDRVLSDQEIQQLYSGSPNYNYNWSPTNETTSSITVQPSATTTYTVDVTSGTTTCQSDVTISVNQRDFVSIDSTACDSIQWAGNWVASTDTYIDTLQNTAGCDSIVTLNLTINQSTFGTDVLSACDTLTWIDGITYSASNDTATYILTNAAGCDSVVTLNLTIHTSPIVNLGNDTILCSGTTIDLNAGNGFIYLWQDGTNDSILTASSSGAYSVTITDGNGCIDSDTINVTIASPLVVTLDSTNITCNGLTDGTATATVTGGTPNYTYLWDDANAQTTATATNLSAGTYTVSVTDDNNCTTTGSISIVEPTLLSATTQEPPQLTDFVYIGEYQNNYIYFHNTGLSWSAADQKCVNNGGQLLVINSATEQSHYASILPSYSWIGLYQDLNDPNYSESSGGWKWVDGTPLSYDNWAVGQPSGGTGENHARFDNLNHEWHDYNINTLSSFAMAINKNVANGLSVSCNGGNDGQTYVTAAGGTAPYSYAWDNGQTTDTAYNLAAGDYIVTVLDASGCTATDTATISEPNLITGLDSITACDTYTWVDGITYTASNNTATHTLTALNGCDSVVSLDLTIITSPTVDLGNDVAICAGDSTLLDAGSGHTNYLWNTGETTQTIFADTAGTYSVTVGNGTTASNSNSLSFDGQDDYIIISNPIIPTSGNFSVSFWANTSVLSNTYAEILSQGSTGTGFYIGYDPSGEIRVTDHWGNIGIYFPNDGLWHNYSLVKDISNTHFYIDGNLAASKGSTIIGSITGSSFLIGKQFAPFAEHFNGSIDEVIVWNVAIPQSEIQQYMSSPPTGSEAGLVGYWNFNEGSGSTVNDLSGNGNNGTLFGGATWSTDAPNQDANNCTATDDVVVTVNPLPTIDLGPDTTLICAGTSITLDASSGNNYDVNVTAAGASDYILSGAFSGNDPPINISVGDVINFNVNSPGHPFYIKTTNTPGSAGAISIANNGTSSGTISWTPTTAGTYYYICEYHPNMLGTITVSNNTGFASYMWNDGSTNPTLSASSAGTYSVVGTDINGCTASDYMVVDVLTVDIAQSDTTICEGDSLVLEVNNIQLFGTLNNGLIGYWPFNGNTNDETNNFNHGVNNGAALTTDRFGNLNSAYSFPGTSNSGIDVNFSNALTSNNFTVSLWANRSGNGWVNPRLFHIIDKNSIQNLEWLDGIWYNNSSSPEYFSRNINNNSWVHLVYSQIGDTLFTYSNGLLDQVTFNSISLNLDSTLSIGKTSYHSAKDAFNGLIDDFGIWNRALTDQEIQQLYNNQNYSYAWSPGGETNSSITVQPSATSTYTVDVTSGTTTCQSDVSISVNQRNFVTVDSTACDSIQWAGNWVASTDTYYDTLQNTNGCDSIVTLNLTINQSTSGTDVIEACDSYTWIDGITYSASNDTATHTLTNAAGCDSVVTLDLTIHNSFYSQENLTVCDSLIWAVNGVTYYTSGTYYDSSITVNNCDSIYRLDLIINNSSTSVTNITACDSIEWNGTTYTTSGTYNHLIQNSQPTYISTPLTFTYWGSNGNGGQPSNDNGNEDAIGFTWGGSNWNDMPSSENHKHIMETSNNLGTISGYTYMGNYNDSYYYRSNSSASWTASKTLAENSGGHLLIENDLQEHNAVENMHSSIGWGPVWIGLYQDYNDANFSEPDGGWKWIDILSAGSSGNIVGCDSTAILNLIINQSTTGTDVLTACDTLTWIDGITYSASNNTATHTLTNAAGCDSVVTLDLTINNSPVVDLGNDTNLCANTTIDLFAGNGFSYSWQDGSTDSSLLVGTTGTYDVTITDTNGCIASDTINVNVLSPLSVVKDSSGVTCYGLSDGTASATVSGGLPPYSYLWVDNGLTYTTPNATNLPAGTYSFVVTDSNGCSLTDSVVISQPLPLTASVSGPDSITDFNFITEYNDQYIYFHQFVDTWENARQKCLSNGGDLIIITDSSELALFISMIPNPPNTSWVGLYQDTVDVNYSEPAGAWKWADGSYPDSLNAFLYFDNVGFNENFGFIGTDGFGIFDYPSTYNLRYFMSIPINTQYNQNVTCNGGNDGSTFVTSAGGIAPYTYLWDNGQTTDTAYNLAAGDYIVTVTDDNGCTTTDTSTITEPALITGTDTQIACDSLTWIDGNTYTASNNTATHILTAANGCDSIVTLDLTINYSPVFSFASDTISACNTDSILIDAGSGYDFYAWSNGANTQQIYATQNGVYALTVTDTNSCSNSDNVLVDILNIDLLQSDTSLCLGDSLLISIDTLSNLQSNSPSVIIVPNDYTTIQTAIDSANINDTIIVMPGNYNENIVWNNKNLVIKSYSGRDHTIIDGQNLDVVIHISGGTIDSTSLLEGFTIRNGSHQQAVSGSAGGILVNNNVGYIHLNNLIVENCNSNTGASGMFFHYGGVAKVENSIIKNNLNGGLQFHSTEGIMNNVVIENNLNNSAIHVYDAGIEINNSEIKNNPHSGITYSGVGYEPNYFQDVLFSNNGTQNNADGGAINLSISGALTNIKNCTFYNNGGSSDIKSNGGYFNDAFTGNNIIIENSIFYESPPNSSRVAIAAVEKTNPLAKDSIYISYCIFNEDTASSLTQSSDAVNFWSVNNLLENTDPLFIDAANNDFDLFASSPAIDSGDPIYLEDDGSRSDIGHTYSVIDDTHTTPNINLGANVTYSWSTAETTAAIHPVPTQTTTYYVTATNGITTCEDSLTISVLPTSSLVIDSTVCDSMFFAGNNLTVSDTYYDTLTNTVGCDSVVTLNLTINNSVATIDSITACDSTTWNGATYTTSGIYTQTLQTVNGCDSVVTMDISINTSPVFTFPQDTLTDCDVDSILVDAGAGYNSYAWSNGANTQQIYAVNNGTYSITVTDANGCTDSDDVLVDILNVDIIQSDTSICLGESITLDATSNIPAFNPTQTMHLVPSEYATIQLAIDAATNGDTVYVSNGTYVENINYNNKDLYLLGENRDSTILDGNLNGSVVILNGNSVIEGFTIQNGSGTSDGANFRGGGIYVNSSADTTYILNCSITNNTMSLLTDTRGAGIYGNSSTYIDNCYIANNNCSQYASGTAVGYLSNCIFENNGGYACSWSKSIDNCLFINNGSRAIHSLTPSGTDLGKVNNVTIINDFPRSSFYFGTNGANISNLILINPTTGYHASTWDSTLVNYSNISGGHLKFSNPTSSQFQNVIWGTGNIDLAPQFVDSANGDYTLVPGSPGVDAGNPDLNGNGIPWQNDPEDQDPDGTRMDMGYGYAAQGPVVNFSSPIISNSSNDVTYAWSTGETTATINPTPTVTTTYYVTVNNGISSCQDSITVNVLPTSALAIDTAVCDSMFFAGNNITTSGLYYDTLTNAVGCDSVVTVDLTIHNSIATNDSAVACDNYTWNGNVYDTSGIYIDTLQTVHGCDSIVTMDLTINYSFYAEESITACDSMTWDNGVTYTTSGIYYDSLQTITGCDSLLMLDLTINPSPVFSFALDTIGACGGDSLLLDAGTGYASYSWNTGANSSTIYASSTGTYSVTIGDGQLPNANNSLSFDGIDDRVIITSNNLPSGNSARSVSAWFYPESGNGNIFAYGDGQVNSRRFSVLMSNGNMYFVGESNDHLGHIVSLNQWHFVTITYGNNELKMYVDGTIVDSTVLGTDLNTDSSYPLVIASNTISRNDEFFGGKVAHVSIWDRVLNATEIQSQVSCPPSYNTSGLLGYWELGNNANDATVYGNNGAIEGAIVTTDAPVFNCNNQNVCTTTDSIYVEILDVDIVQNDTTICQGDSIELTVVSSSNSSDDLGGSLNNGLVAYYPFNGNANDESGNGNNGTVNGATLTNDRFGNADEAYDFDGIDDCIDINSQSIDLFIYNSMTLSFWTNPNNIDNSNLLGTVISKYYQGDENNSSFAISINESTRAIETFGDGLLPIYSTQNNIVDYQSWDNYTVYLDKLNGTATVFKNGNFIGLGSVSFNNLQISNVITSIGRVYAGIPGAVNSNHFDGNIDDIGIWNRALTSQEIQELYNSQYNHSYAWSNGETTETIHVAPSQTTTYYVTANNGISSCQDSITVTVLPTSALAIDTAVCDSIFFAGNTITTSGLYYDTLSNAVGCDSVVTLDLTIHNSIATNDSAVACDNYTWNANVYDTSGIYIDTLQTVHGCDSIVTMDLTINYSFYAEESITACDGFTWDNGITYTQTGIFYDSLQTIAGCDSVYMLDLTINPSPVFSFAQDTVGACGGDSVLLDAGAGHTNYLWSTGDTTQTIYASATGTYSVTVGNGTVNGGGSSLDFDGVDDGINANASSSLNISNTNNLTLSAWVKPTSNNHGFIFVHGSSSGNGQGQYQLQIDANQKVYFTTAGAVNTPGSFETNNIFNVSNSTLNQNQWSYITITYDNSAIKIYINGNLDFQNNVVDIFPTNYIGEFFIGRNGINTQLFNGKIDGINVWSNALTQSEIQYYMNCPPTGNEVGLVGYWNIDEGTGTTLTDLSGNGNDGTINGATWSTNTPTQICDNCTTTDSIYVEILDVDIVQNDTTICQGDSIELSVVSSSNGSDDLGGILNNGIVGFWPFNGNANDESGNGNDGIVNGASLTADRFGNADEAYNFDGIDDYIKVSDHPTLNPSNEISINLWFKVETAFNGSGNDALIDKPFTSHVDPFYQYHLGLSGLNETVPFNGVIESDISVDGVVKYLETTNSSYELNQWYMLTFTYDGSKIKLYKNNTLLQELVVLGPIDSYGQDLFFGAFGNLSSFTPVTLDEVVIWGRALTSQEIQELYNSQSNHSYAWSNGETTETIHVAPTQTTTYYVTASNGISSCQDSVTVNVLPTSALLIDTAVCDSIFFAGNTITTSGLYYDTLSNAVGCDSVVTLDLTIHNSIATTDSLVICDSAIWNGNVYDTSGIYIDTLQTVHGCDSIVTMDLTINYSFYAEESITACDSMTWDNGVTYTQTGIYYDSLQTTAGCDSVYMLDLTINPSPLFSFAQDTVGACGGDSVLLDAGSGHTNYLWSTGDTTQT